MLKELIKDIKDLEDPERAKILQRFFKTGKGEYGEGDIFIGLTVPQERQVAKKYFNISLEETQKLISNKIHEYRQISLFILIIKYKKANKKGKKEIFDFYLRNIDRINNWDLVDSSAEHIVGDYLLEKNKSLLYKLVKSKNLWRRRIAVLSTFAFIKNNRFEDTLALSEFLLKGKQDLIHKAVGWMLREIGNRNKEVEENFLKKHYKIMPRTMLRYAIEKFNEKERKFYLNKI